MDYSELTTCIEDICEESFTATQLAKFVQQAERRIYNTVEFPALRKTCEGTATQDNEYLTVPADFIYPHSIYLTDASSNAQFLIQVDPNFVREAFPNRATTGQPRYYGLFDVDSLILGPTPDTNYTVRITYGYFPESIVTATNTWLGDNFDPALLNASLVEAARFMKEEEDVIRMYDKLYLESLALLKQLGDGKLRKDSYRSGQYRQAVT